MSSAANAANAANAASATVFLGRRRLRLDDRALIGEGGEGRVYRAGDLAIKVFTSPDASRERKLRDYPATLPPRVLGPLELATDDGGRVVGFAMRALDGGHELRNFSQRRWREGRVSNAAVLRLFRELSETVERMHLRGIVVGDLNDGNVLTTPPASTKASDWTPWLIDADSMQFGHHRCVVAHERFLDPRLYGVDLARVTALSRESDWYALAVLLFGSLLYVHPFGGSHPSHATMLRRAEARCSVLQPSVKLPGAAIRPEVLPDEALLWFERVFERDLREPLPSSILEARFVKCSCGAEHARPSCPLCTAKVHVAPAVVTRGGLRSTRVFRTRGRIVAAAILQDGLKHAYEEGGCLFREDGAAVVRSDGPPELRDPDRLVRIAGHATWIGARGRFSKVICGQVRASVPVGAVRGALAADAGPDGVVHVEGDLLVRAEDGTRIGQVLEGQTHVRVSSTLGFAFYRASAITVAFVFDPRRGVLRQIERFPRLDGKLVGWSAVFDDAHVLVTFACEKNGRVEHATHLVDARGQLLATETSAASALGTSLGGRTIAGGNVIVATPDGLVLLRADRDRRFVPARLFSEARELVSPDAELLVGPAGSLFVVTDDEITHLCFTR